jgi:RNase P/RNase MRP subunit p29
MTDSMTNTTKERQFLRQWIGKNVKVTDSNESVYNGCLTNIVFDGNRLMYIMLDDKRCINFDHIVEVSLS